MYTKLFNKFFKLLYRNNFDLYLISKIYLITFSVSIKYKGSKPLFILLIAECPPKTNKISLKIF